MTDSDLIGSHVGSPKIGGSSQILVRGTIAVAIVEWLMFELLRTPYAPPGSMLTLLGTEKHAVVGIMAVLGGIWLISTAAFLVTKKMTIRELMSFVALLCTIMAFYLFISKNPMRYVTPWELMWS